MTDLTNLIRSRRVEINGSSEPDFFDLSLQEERTRFELLLSSNPQIQVLDEIRGQLGEFVKISHPKLKLSKEQIQEKVDAKLDATPSDEYGNWVYYPWKNQVVHVLPKDEFIAVRTNRNVYKITPQELETLSKKKIGVIGLSVGQSVALTMAMERIFGEIRIADFDELELSNLNRLRSGVEDLNLKKTTLVAREIAEMDPYLKVVAYPEGINADNIEDFLTEGGKLDLLAEECDDIYIKIQARLKARELKIPVVMETSDRGMLDIERFDLEPDRSILHGVIDHLDFEAAKNFKSSEEKVPFVIPMLGIDEISGRLKASMVEIESSVGSWPQLASSVTLGGGLVCIAARRVLLNHPQKSGRYYCDVEGILDQPSHAFKDAKVSFFEPKKRVEMDYQAQAELAIAENAPELTEQQAKQIVEAANLAPSAGNLQPWKWVFHQGQLMLFLDPNQTNAASDYRSRAAKIGLGCALYNAENKMLELDVKGSFEVLPIVTMPNLMARLVPPGHKCFDSEDSHKKLAPHIHYRHTSRDGALDDVSAEINKLMEAAQNADGFEMRFATERGQIEELAELISYAEARRLLNPAMHESFFMDEVKLTQEQFDEDRYGLFVKDLDLSATEEIGLQVVKDPKVIDLVNRWGQGRGLQKISREKILNSGALGYIFHPTRSEENFIRGGALSQKIWVEANRYDVALHPVTTPIYMFDRLEQDKDFFSPFEQQEMRTIYNDFRKIFNVEHDNVTQILLFRLSKVTKPASRPEYVRRSLDATFVNTRTLVNKT